MTSRVWGPEKRGSIATGAPAGGSGGPFVYFQAPHSWLLSVGNNLLLVFLINVKELADALLPIEAANTVLQFAF